MGTSGTPVALCKLVGASKRSIGYRMGLLLAILAAAGAAPVTAEGAAAAVQAPLEPDSAAADCRAIDPAGLDPAKSAAMPPLPIAWRSKPPPGRAISAAISAERSMR